MRLVVSAVMLVAFLCTAAEAQVQPNTTGFYLAGHFNGSALSVEGDPLEAGGGGGIDLGWGFGGGVLCCTSPETARSWRPRTAPARTT